MLSEVEKARLAVLTALVIKTDAEKKEFADLEAKEAK
jgi:hypothetical protein